MSKTKKRLIIILVACLFVLACFASTISDVYAKYVVQESSDKLVATSTQFYFSSDYLSETSSQTYHIADWDSESDKITIQLYNYESSLEVTSADIEYTVTVSDGVTYTINGSDENVYGWNTDSTGEYAEIVIGTEYVDFTNGVATVEVAVKCTAPFEKTLSATFVFYEGATAEVSYNNISNSSNYAIVTVKTNDQSGDMTIKYPTSLIANLSDSMLTAVGNDYDEVTFTVNSNSSYEFIFFKADTSKIYDTVISCNDSTITITQTDTTETES